MPNRKSSCQRYPEFDQFDKIDQPTCGNEDDDDDNVGWHIEDFDLGQYAVDEDPTTPNGSAVHNPDRFFESPANVLSLIKQQQNIMADFFITLDNTSQGSPQKQIELIRAQIATSHQNLAGLLLRLDIAREIDNLRHRHRKQDKLIG